MTPSIDLNTLVHVIGPDFAARSADTDADDAFVAENYETLKARKVFPALVPTDLGTTVFAYGLGKQEMSLCATKWFARPKAWVVPVSGHPGVFWRSTPIRKPWQRRHLNTFQERRNPAG